MDPQLTIFVGILFTAAFLGAVFTWMAFAAPARRRLSAEREEREELAVAKAAATAVADRVPRLERMIDTLRERLETANGELSEVRATLESERASHGARVEELEKVSVEIEQKFTALATDVLGKNSESFLTLAAERFDKHKETAERDLGERQKAIETLLKPIGEGLVRFTDKMGEIERVREGAYRAVTEQVRNLAAGQTDLRSETGRLVRALRQPKTRGRWGEYQLRNVLEMAGMTEHVDFVSERTIDSETEDGAAVRLRPDAVVRLPGGKSIIVDAKTPLDAYLAAAETDDDAARTTHIERHARQVAGHVRALASKEYWKELPVTPDFVAMFVPGEAFFAAAIENDPELFERAVKDRVLICTPTTFIALIKAIAYGWQQQKLAESTQAVADLGRDLFQRIKTFASHVDHLGQALRQAVTHYNNGVGSLEGRLLPAARKFEALGVAPAGSSIPAVEPVDLEARAPHAPELAE